MHNSGLILRQFRGLRCRRHFRYVQNLGEMAAAASDCACRKIQRMGPFSAPTGVRSGSRLMAEQKKSQEATVDPETSDALKLAAIEHKSNSDALQNAAASHGRRRLRSNEF